MECPFGENTTWNGSEMVLIQQEIKVRRHNLWVDNFYISIMQRFGIIVMIIVVLLLTYTLIKCLKNKNYYLMFMLTFIAGHCIVDDLFLYLHYNYILVFDWFSINGKK